MTFVLCQVCDLLYFYKLKQLNVLRGRDLYFWVCSLSRLVFSVRWKQRPSAVWPWLEIQVHLQKATCERTQHLSGPKQTSGPKDVPGVTTALVPGA